MVVLLLVVDQDTGEITLGPDLVSKGFIFEQQYAHLLDDAKCVILDVFEDTNPSDLKRIKEKIRSSLRRFFRKVLERDPVVVPVVISI
jgi:ribonuclease J